MGVTKPSVTSILSCLMKHDVIVRKRYGKVYLTDRGVLYARYYDDLLQKILQHFPLEGDFTTEEKEDAHGRRPARTGSGCPLCGVVR